MSADKKYRCGPLLRRRLSFFLLTILAALPACKTFEYEPEQATLVGNTVQVANIGFKGYRIEPPDSFRRLSVSEVNELPARHWIHNLKKGYSESEGMDYHFYGDHVFQHNGQLIYFVPFINKRVGKFRFVPRDILERYLVDWARRAEFAKLIDLKLSWRAVSDRQRGRSTVILRSKEPVNGMVYEERVLTGDLNEMFLIAGFALPDNADALNQSLTRLEESIEVIR